MRRKDNIFLAFSKFLFKLQSNIFTLCYFTSFQHFRTQATRDAFYLNLMRRVTLFTGLAKDATEQRRAPSSLEYRVALGNGRSPWNKPRRKQAHGSTTLISLCLPGLTSAQKTSPAPHNIRINQPLFVAIPV